MDGIDGMAGPEAMGIKDERISLLHSWSTQYHGASYTKLNLPIDEASDEELHKSDAS
jgi:hypothetical protein